METPERKTPALVDRMFRFAIIGDAAVGKSCLLMQFTDHKFRPGLDQTIGAESSSRIINIAGGDGGGDKRTKLTIWDMSGHEAFRSITRSYYRLADAFILVYDVTRRETFDHVGDWLTEAKQRAPANLTVVLVGNKCDLHQERAVSYEEGRGFAEEHGLVFMEASAKTDCNVEEVFFTAARIVNQKLDDGVIVDESVSFGGMKLDGRYCVPRTLERKWWWWWLCCS